MRYRLLGQTGLYVSELCLGTMTYGGNSGIWETIGNLQQDAVNEQVKFAVDAGINFINRLRVCTNAVSLGTCDTLVSHAASTTHLGVDREQRLKFGITDGLIRMSVGIENVEDILNDLEQAIS